MRKLPRLGIVYEAESIPLLTLRRDLAELCDITWILDPTVPQIADSLPILRRLGKVIELSPTETTATVELLRSSALDGITTFSDNAILATAELASQLGLRGNSSQAANRIVDKWQQRQALHDAGIPTQPFALIPHTTSPDDTGQATAAVGYPAVLKPATGNGGRYVHHITGDASFAAALQSIRAQGFDGDLILERELVGQQRPPFGDYVSVECVGDGVRMHVVTVTGRMPLAPPFRETGAFIPAALPSAVEREVMEMAVTAAAAIGVAYGCLHIEIKLTPDGPRIIEINGRVAGGGIPDLVADVTGISMYGLAARSALGLPLPPLATKLADVVSYQFALQAPLDVETELTDDAVPLLEAVDSVRRVGVRSRIATPSAAAGSYDYLLMLYGVARTHDEIVAAYDAMNSVTRTAKPR